MTVRKIIYIYMFLVCGYAISGDSTFPLSREVDGRLVQDEHLLLYIADGYTIDYSTRWKEGVAVFHGQVAVYDVKLEIVLEGAYENGLRHGEWLTYHPNGQVASRTTYVSGYISGHMLHWQVDGRLVHSAFYVRGRRAGHEIYLSSDGRLSTSINWRENRPESIRQYTDDVLVREMRGRDAIEYIVARGKDMLLPGSDRGRPLEAGSRDKKSPSSPPR